MERIIKKLLSFLLLCPLFAHAQLSTYTLSWDGVTPDQSINVAASCSINDGAYFHAITVPSFQNTADVIADLQPGNKIACYAQTTDGVSYSPQSNLAAAYEPLQISAQLCVAAGSGTWQAVGGPIFAVKPLEIYGNWDEIKAQRRFQVTGGAYSGMPCGEQIIMQIGTRSYHPVAYGMTECVLR